VAQGIPMNTERARLLAELLREMRTSDGDYIPDEVWLEAHKTFSLPYVELVIPRRAGDKWEVFLTRRPVNDPHWPSTWHLPGGIWRTGQSESQACQSVALRELGIQLDEIKEIMTYKWTTHPYGVPVSHICLCTLMSSLTKSVDRGYFAQLPKPFIPEHVRFVEECLKYLGKRRNGHLKE
jgi:ADP-ribose pyrophosphatase YjhB (NUDIX family)